MGVENVGIGDAVSIGIGDAVSIEVVRAMDFEILLPIVALAAIGIVTFLVSHKFKRWGNSLTEKTGVKNNED